MPFDRRLSRALGAIQQASAPTSTLSRTTLASLPRSSTLRQKTGRQAESPVLISAWRGEEDVTEATPQQG